MYTFHMESLVSASLLSQTPWENIKSYRVAHFMMGGCTWDWIFCLRQLHLITSHLLAFWPFLGGILPLFSTLHPESLSQLHTAIHGSIIGSSLYRKTALSTHKSVQCLLWFLSLPNVTQQTKAVCLPASLFRAKDTHLSRVDSIHFACLKFSLHR